MRSTLLSEWLEKIGMLTFGDEPPKEDDDNDDNDDNEDENSDDDSDDDEEEDDDDGEKPDVNKLKDALKKERLARKKFEKELKAKQREEARRKKEGDDELEVTKEENTKLADLNSKLATRLLDQAVDQEIVKVAQKLNFRDLEDALTLVKRSEIEVEQDEDDPSEVEIDSDSVLAAVKALAAKKPHLLIADGDREPSGSKFSGGKGKKKAEASEQALKAKYSALSR